MKGHFNRFFLAQLNIYIEHSHREGTNGFLTSKPQSNKRNVSCP